MSEPKLISPLLDGFAMGSPISNHHGVQCCPAMRDGSDVKYIVKMISIPASQVQLDALLLSGAYRSKEAAVEYFADLAQGIIKEAEVLERLAKLEGFTAYESWQIVPMEDGTGFDVYLLGTYKRSLAKHMQRSQMTQLEAINLGLDLCAALAGCRRAGCLYLDLKPENIFIGEDQSYRIGDLGLILLSSLKYASLPDRYRSSYTPPEITDAYSSLNDTIDIYALGLTLYQVYNGGVLPFDGTAPAEALPAPMYADYEMAEIILKACDPDPAKRWQDPGQMGQALVGYMQRNGANDVPIVPPPAVLNEEPEAPAAGVSEPSEPEDASAPENPEDIADLSFIDRLVSDETAPTEESASGLDDTAVSEETSEILAMADDLIAHQTPDPVVAPEKIDVPIPEPIVPEPEVPEETAAPAAEETEEPLDSSLFDQDDIEEVEEDPLLIPTPVKKRRSRKWIWLLVVLVLLAGLAFGGYYYYENYYLQEVTAFEVSGVGNQMTVTVKSEAPEDKLTVICTDTYGNTIPSKVTNGQAQFTELNPNTQYHVELVIEGTYKLVGKTTDTYTTPAQSNIASFQAITGAEDGSVILSFTVDGPEAEDGWIITCSAEGEEDRVQTVTAHWATFSGLTVGTEYKFTVSSPDPIEVVGQTEITVTASRVITAQNLSITACGGEQLTVSWEAPESDPVSQWTVRCYSEAGYDVTQEVSDPEAVFTGIDVSQAYTVEVTAQGMTQCAQTNITANPITILSVQANSSGVSELTFQWSYDGAAPENGWLVMCSVDGQPPREIIKAEDSSLSVTWIPGSTYDLTIQTVDNTTMFNNTFSYQLPQTEAFSGYNIAADNLTYQLCRTPEKFGWSWDDVPDEDFITSFAPGEKASLVIRIHGKYAVSSDQIVTQFVIRDESGAAVQTGSSTSTWSKLWSKGYGEFDLPALPEEPGSYTVYVYFNGKLAVTAGFTVTG